MKWAGSLALSLEMVLKTVLEMSKQIYIYSGISPGKKGTGNFLSYFLEQFINNNIDFTLISHKTPNTGYVSIIAKKLGLIKILRSIFMFFSNFFAKKNINNSIVFLFHPQSIGLNQSIDLIKNNQVYFYVLDTFFFCKKSYNYISGNSPCFKCMSNTNASLENNCGFSIFNHKDEDYHNFQNTIFKNLSSINFLTQNDNQLRLLKQKFGDKINVKTLGMLINLKNDIIEKDDSEFSYDFVFHNTGLKPKGLDYFIKLAKEMVNHSFLIPYKSSDLHSSIEDIQNIINIDFIPMTWETGLRNAIVNCKIVINPSLWSAPVEGALLKSIMYNGCVAIVPVDFSFQKEIPSESVIQLYTDIKKTKKKLTSIVTSKKLIDDYKIKSFEWLNSYQNTTESNFINFFKDLKNL